MNSKVKVSTAALLDAVKARRAKLEADYEQALGKFERDTASYQGKVVVALESALASAQKGKLPKHDNSYYGKTLEVLVRFEHPVKPSPLNLTTIDRLIATLEMAAEDTISISAGDAAQYLG